MTEADIAQDAPGFAAAILYLTWRHGRDIEPEPVASTGGAREMKE